MSTKQTQVESIKERLRFAVHPARDDAEFLRLCDCAIDEAMEVGIQLGKDGERIKELELLEAHIEKQLGGYDTVRIHSLLKYIEDRVASLTNKEEIQ